LLRTQFKFILKYFSFWFIVFFMQRNIFLLFFSKTTHFDLREWILCNTHSFFIDVATISYILLPIIAFTISKYVYTNLKFVKIISYYTIIVLVISNFIFISDLGLFGAWGIKLNHKAFSYMVYPKQAFAAIKSAPLLLLFLIFIVKTTSELFLFKKINLEQKPTHIKWYKKMVFVVSFFLLVFVGLRGGAQTFPINRSWSYFSEKTLLNQAAVNSSWNALAALTESNEIEANPYNFFNAEKENRIFKSLTSRGKSNDGAKLFNTVKPNIIIVLLESWGAETVGALNKEIDATPHYSTLAKEGLLFTNFYATGFRTEQPLAAMVAGFPAQPKTTIIRKFGKFDRLPSLAKDLSSIGYHTSFYHGGDIEFANMEAYLYSAGFNKIIGQNDFIYKLYNEWGAFDEELFNFFLKDMSGAKQPFFSILLTSTSHEPFDHRVEEHFKGDGLVSEYLNVLYYSDKALYDFLEASKTEPWYQNTIFIMLGDHTNRMPKFRQNYEIERHWIPCMIYGPALNEKYAGKRIEKVCSQIDVPAILLSQLNVDYSHFIWSKEIINSYSNHWAFYTFDEGFGFIKNRDQIVFDLNQNKMIYANQFNTKVNDELCTDGKGLLQKLLDEYIFYDNRF